MENPTGETHSQNRVYALVAFLIFFFGVPAFAYYLFIAPAPPLKPGINDAVNDTYTDPDEDTNRPDESGDSETPDDGIIAYSFLTGYGDQGPADTTQTIVQGSPDLNTPHVPQLTGDVGPWTVSDSPLPMPRNRTSQILTNGHLYVFGGSNSGASSQQNTVFAAPISDDGDVGEWQTTVMPTNRHRTGGALHNNYVYLLGGGNGITTVTYAHLNTDGTIGAWQTNPNGLPAGRQQLSAEAYNGYLYAVAGCNSGSCAVPQSTVFYAPINLDGSTGAWLTNPTPLPEPRAGNTSTIANGFLYVIAGRLDASTTANTSYFAELQPDGSTGAWSEGPVLPVAVSNHGMVHANGYLYVIAGSGTAGYQSLIQYAKLNDDGSLDDWQTSSYSLPVGITLLYTATTDGERVYIAGGTADGSIVGAETTVYSAPFVYN